MATGSPFTGRNTNTDSGNVLNNPIIQANAYREMIAKSAWGSMTVDVDVANDGLVMANSGGEGLVKRVNIAKTAGTRQTRWAYAKEIQGFPATFGQQIAPLADKNQFLYSMLECCCQPLFARLLLMSQLMRKRKSELRMILTVSYPMFYFTQQRYDSQIPI